MTAVVVDRYYLSRRIDQFAALIRELDAERGGANAADFRDRLGVGRKLAIRAGVLRSQRFYPPQG